jgi:microcystin-dependent protein
MPDLNQILAIAANFGVRTVTLSPDSLTVLFTCLDAANRRYDWTVNGNRPDESEWDEIDAILSLARYELMTSMVGQIITWAGNEIPENTLLCDGSTLDRIDYPILYAAIAPQFIVDADTFNLPDLRGKFVFGGSDTDESGDTGGYSEITLDVTEMPSHSHTDIGHVHTVETTLTLPAQAGVGFGGLTEVPFIPSNTGVASANLTDTGGDLPHDNMPPYCVLAYLIVTG